MDYVPAHKNTQNLADRDNISGARVFDGEDQGKYTLNVLDSDKANYANLNKVYLNKKTRTTMIILNLIFYKLYRFWKPHPSSTVTAERLDSTTTQRT